MSQLSAQSIEARCLTETPMISPFFPEKMRINGKSAGLSHASYDCRIDHDLVLGRHPAFILKDWLLAQDFSTVRGIARMLRALPSLQAQLRDEPPCYSLAYTMEDFHLPADVSGAVCDKSTYARLFVSAFNTFFDPGFKGNATLELVNHSDQRVTYRRGDPVCQFIFTHLDEPTRKPYDGKYQHQTKAAHGPRHENADGTWRPEGEGLIPVHFVGDNGAIPPAAIRRVVEDATRNALRPGGLLWSPQRDRDLTRDLI